MEKLITRRGVFIVSYQLEGLCVALRMLVQTGAPPGDATRAIVKKLRSSFQKLVANGDFIDGWPEVSEDMSAADLLSLAETLRMSAVCFLTPDESEERKRAIGFSNEEKA